MWLWNVEEGFRAVEGGERWWREREAVQREWQRHTAASTVKCNNAAGKGEEAVILTLKQQT